MSDKIVTINLDDPMVTDDDLRITDATTELEVGISMRMTIKDHPVEHPMLKGKYALVVYAPGGAWFAVDYEGIVTGDPLAAQCQIEDAREKLPKQWVGPALGLARLAEIV